MKKLLALIHLPASRDTHDCNQGKDDEEFHVSLSLIPDSKLHKINRLNDESSESALP